MNGLQLTADPVTLALRFLDFCADAAAGEEKGGVSTIASRIAVADSHHRATRDVRRAVSL